MPKRVFLFALLAGLTGVSALAQSYQTQFGDIKFDRSKGPATWSGGVEVDQATGALSLNLPLGPGIGARGLKFQPVLKGNWSPKLDTRTWCLNSKTNEWGSGTSVSNNGGFSLTPGYFNLMFDPNGDESVTNSDPSPVRIRSPKLTHYVAPDGFSGSLNPDEPDPGYLPTVVQAQALIQAYGFGSGWAIGNAVWQQATGGPKGYFIFRGPGGELVLGLVHPTLAPEQACSPVIGTALKAVTSSPGSYYHFPGAILVINGSLGYHYQWRSNRYSQLDLTWVAQNVATIYNGEDPTWVGVRFIRHAGFAMASMRNRSGDRIEFTKPLAGSWTASWFTSLGDTGVSIGFDGTTLHYQGVSNPPQFHLEGIALAWPNTNESLDGFSTTSSQTSALNDKGYDGFRECEVAAVVDDVSQDRVTIQYDRSPSEAGANSYWSHPNKLTFPGKAVSLTWGLYEYFRNLPDSLNLVPDHY